MDEYFVNLVPCNGIIKKADRVRLKGSKPVILWFTGLSGAGKSTLACALDVKLYEERIHTYLLDGDNIRLGLNKDLGFTNTDRKENIRRIGEVAKLFIDAGLLIMAAFISPFKEDRECVRALVQKNEFIEIYVKCPLEICEQRDVKGLYKKARNGMLKQFTGVDQVYEEPDNPEIIVDTYKQNIDESVNIIYQYLKKYRILK